MTEKCLEFSGSSWRWRIPAQQQQVPGAGRTSSEGCRGQGWGPVLAQVLTLVSFVNRTDLICYSFYKQLHPPQNSSGSKTGFQGRD